MALQQLCRTAVEGSLAVTAIRCRASEFLMNNTRTFSSAVKHYPSNPENVIRPLTPRELGNLQQPHNEKLVKHQYKLLRMCHPQSYEDQYEKLIENHVAQLSVGSADRDTSPAALRRPAFLPQAEVVRLPFLPYKSLDSDSPTDQLDALSQPDELTPSLMESLAKSAAAICALDVYSNAASKSTFDYLKLGKSSIPYLEPKSKGAKPGNPGRLDSDENWRLAFHSAEKVEEPLKLVPLEERKQLPLTKEQAKKLWDRAEELAHLDALPEVIVGKFGLTANLIRNVDFALKGRKLVRVKIGSTAPSLSPKFVAFVLENTLDCATVRTKGYTVTIFRG